MERALSGIFAKIVFTTRWSGPNEQAVACATLIFAPATSDHIESGSSRVSCGNGGFWLEGKIQLTFRRETPFVIPIAPLAGSPNKVRGLDGWPGDAFPRRVLYKVGMLETALGICRPWACRCVHSKIYSRIGHTRSSRLNPPRGKVDAEEIPQQKEYVYLVKRKRLGDNSQKNWDPRFEIFVLSRLI